MPTRPRPALVALLAAAVLVAGCGDDDDPEEGAGATSTTATTTTAGSAATDGEGTSTPSAPEDLPPLDELTESNIEGLRAVYGPPLGELDLRVTRGGVVTYRGGNHLQLYVEPTTAEEDNPPAVYLRRMLTSFQAIIPVLFDAYPEMDTFDLCQEPVPEASAPPTEPGYEEPVTLLLLSRAGFESVDDWSTATLADLFAAADEALDGVLSVSPEVAELPEYQEAIAS